MILGYRKPRMQNMVQIESICIIPLPDLLFCIFVREKFKIRLLSVPHQYRPSFGAGGPLNGRVGRYWCGTDKRRIFIITPNITEK